MDGYATTPDSECYETRAATMAVAHRTGNGWPAVAAAKGGQVRFAGMARSVFRTNLTCPPFAGASRSGRLGQRSRWQARAAIYLRRRMPLLPPHGHRPGLGDESARAGDPRSRSAGEGAPSAEAV